MEAELARNVRSSAKEVFSQRCLRFPSFTPSDEAWIDAIDTTLGYHSYPPDLIRDYVSSDEFQEYAQAFRDDLDTKRTSHLLRGYGNVWYLDFVQTEDLEVHEIVRIDELAQDEVMKRIWNSKCEDPDSKDFLSQFNESEKELLFQEISSLTAFAIYGIEASGGQIDSSNECLPSYFGYAYHAVLQSHMTCVRNVPEKSLLPYNQRKYINSQLKKLLRSGWSGIDTIISSGQTENRSLVQRYITSCVDQIHDHMSSSVTHLIQESLSTAEFEKKFQAALEYLFFLTECSPSRSFSFQDEEKLASKIYPRFGLSQRERLLYSISEDPAGEDSSLLVGGLVQAVQENRADGVSFFRGTQLYTLMSAGLPDAASLAHIFDLDLKTIVPVRRSRILLDRVDESAVPLFVDHMISTSDSLEAITKHYRDRPHKIVITMGLHSSQHQWFENRGYTIVGTCGPMVLINYS